MDDDYDIDYLVDYPPDSPPLPAEHNSGPPLPEHRNNNFCACCCVERKSWSDSFEELMQTLKHFEHLNLSQAPPAAPSSGSGSKQKDAPDVLGVGVQNTGGVPAAMPEGNVDSSEASSGNPSSGKRRGRLPGSRITPYIITVNEGEDIVSTIAGLQGPRRVSILSSGGSVSDVTLRQLEPPGFAFHAGQHDIIKLTSSLPENADEQIVLNLEMAGQGNAVYGGEVLGELRAASEIKITVASYVDERYKRRKGGTSPAPGPMGGLLPIL